jgi:alkylresorcinol/alkylpyrone synthase
MYSSILSVATANPAHRVSQPEVRELVRVMFDRLSGLERLLSIFENTGIESRYISAPPQWFTQPRSFADKNQLWFETALQLSETACRKALTLAGVEPEQIGALVLVTTTGITTPGLEAYLIQRLGIPLGAVRLPIWGLGCAGGPAGLARAAEIAQSRPRQYVLLVCVELCSLTFVRGDLSKSNLVATSLFADGAAAVVLGMPNFFQFSRWPIRAGWVQPAVAEQLRGDGLGCGTRRSASPLCSEHPGAGGRPTRRPDPGWAR